MDVNAAGLRKPVGEIYPSADFLEMFHRRGVPIILSSDAHAPERGRRWATTRASKLVHDVGYREVATFREPRTRYPPAVTEELFLEDSYLKEFEARVVKTRRPRGDPGRDRLLSRWRGTAGGQGVTWHRSRQGGRRGRAA